MRVAFLTAGGIAPCLTASIGSLIKEYQKINTEFEFIGYLNGYKGLLMADYVILNDFNNIDELNHFGGSLLGNSRVKLTNIDDCIKNNYIDKGQIPLEVAGKELIRNKIDILHTIGGDDTNTTAADLVEYVENKKYKITVVGLPKTIDNDVYPIKQTLGAFTAAEETANFFKNIVNENTTSSRHLIIHEVMGRNCGWLTAYSALLYRKMINNKTFVPNLFISKNKWDIHAIYIPELNYDLESESKRLNKVMDQFDCVNIFLSEGAGLDSIIADMKNNNEEIKYDAFGHVRLDEINPGKWFGNYFKNKLNANKVLIQKSGYFARSSEPCSNDIELINKSATFAVEMAIDKKSGVVGLSESTNNIELIKFKEIKGNKPFDANCKWFEGMIKEVLN